MVKKLLTQIKHKTLTGEEVVMDIGAKASNVLPENFVEQQERSNLAAKDKLPVIFGKLSKWYTDLKAVAWSGSYSDLINKPTIPEGSAANYQVANNDTTEAEGFVADARIVRTHGLEIDGLSRDIDVILQKLSSGFRIELSIGQYVWKPEDESKWHGSGDSARITIEIGADGTATAKVTNSGDFLAYGTDHARINKVGIISVHPL